MLQVLPGRSFLPRYGLPLYQKHPRAGTSLRTDPRSLYLGRAATHPAAPQHRLQAEYHQQPPVRRLPYPEPRHDAGLEFDPAFFRPHRRLPHGRIAPGRPDRRKPQNDRTALPDRFARGLLHQKQAAGQRRCGPGQPPANRLFQHLFRYFGRGDRKTLQPLPDFVQKGIFPHLRDLAPPMAHPATPDPCPVASDLDRQGDRRNRHRMRPFPTPRTSSNSSANNTA